MPKRGQRKNSTQKSKPYKPSTAKQMVDTHNKVYGMRKGK
ncbi:hypothetical protein AS52_00248 [Priestia megaterium Q3]|uniref:Uncharacterized protein n=1 Tax=Priestia megaterium Q3 TaxID=1452722 RepID=A0A806TLR6_PRIMG|nr:hypothetical protein AS52_00248 [Priestia megaterium Q3]